MTLPAIIESLDDLSFGECNERAARARSLMTRIDSAFVIHLVVMKKVLSLCSNVAESLQSDNLIIDQAQLLVAALKIALTVAELQEPDEEWDILYKEANSIIEYCNLQSLPTRKIRRARADREERVKNWQESDDYRKLLYIPLCEKVVIELSKRFLSDELGIVYPGIGALTPASQKSLDIDVVTKFAILYNVIKNNEMEKDILTTQIKILSAMIQGDSNEEDSPSTLLDLLNYIIPFEKCMPYLTSCIKIAVTLPCTTVSNGRTFNMMARIKDCKRSRMLDSRLRGLGVLGVNRERTLVIDENALVDRFATKPRRITLN